MKLVPLGQNVIIKREEPDEMTAGGILLPNTAKEKAARGKVLSVGDGQHLPCGKCCGHQVVEGDRVLFSKYAGTEVVIGEDEFLIIPENQILAVIT